MSAQIAYISNLLFISSSCFQGIFPKFPDAHTDPGSGAAGDSKEQKIVAQRDCLKGFQRCQSQIIFFISNFKLKININKNLLVNFTVK